MKELLFSFFFALVIGSAINGWMQSNTGNASPGRPPAAESAAPSAQGSPAGASPVTDTTEANFKSDVLESKMPVLVDFSASWCAPCKAMAPIIDRVATKYSNKLKAVRVDVDNNPELAEKFKIGPIPTFMIFRDGKRRISFSGFTPEGVLESTIKQFID